IKIPKHSGLLANSNGDVVLHALCNAISSAIGQGSLGQYATPLYKNKKITNSAEYLKTIFEKAKKKNFKINNISISIEAKTPKIDKYAEQMKSAISKILKIKTDEIGITATTGEGLTAFGKGQGIAVIAIVMLIST
ncbi:MAG: 2-C-methyl-D-erythritol 2,4-cyclodiphosphate synthase, partial [bacterium]